MGWITDVYVELVNRFARRTFSSARSQFLGDIRAILASRRETDLVRRLARNIPSPPAELRPSDLRDFLEFVGDRTIQEMLNRIGRSFQYRAIERLGGVHVELARQGSILETVNAMGLANTPGAGILGIRTSQIGRGIEETVGVFRSLIEATERVFLEVAPTAEVPASTVRQLEEISGEFLRRMDALERLIEEDALIDLIPQRVFFNVQDSLVDIVGKIRSAVLEKFGVIEIPTIRREELLRRLQVARRGARR